MEDKVSKHTSLIANSDIHDICRRLNKLNISYFSHVHIDKKGNFSGLSNNPQFSEHYLRKQYYNADIHMAEANQFGNFVLWDALERTGDTEKMDKEAEEFDIKHTFTIIDDKKQGCDFYHFSTHLSAWSFNQVYLSNLDLLKKFIVYFKDSTQHSKDVQKIYNIKFSLNNNAPGFELKESINHTNIRSSFLETIPLNQQARLLPNCSMLEIDNAQIEHFRSLFLDLSFSNREIECILLSLQGKPAKQVAYILGISRRTVEEHLDNTKAKLGVYSKAEMIEKILKNLTELTR